jgi:hypothetical protein
MTSNNGLGLIGQEQSGSYQNYHFDSRGSTLAMTDANGVVTDRFQYDSYGGSLSHTGASDTPFQYNGQFGVQTDPNGALVHARPLLQPGDPALCQPRCPVW